eukprot:GHVS01000476.1.p1 GENE.GHVS01000476.1~~GHVS01000476.1.p1  ORF type:complete len:173 (-),score=36.18 GHVS01000476.1:106-624(-)
MLVWRANRKAESSTNSEDTGMMSELLTSGDRMIVELIDWFETGLSLVRDFDGSEGGRVMRKGDIGTKRKEQNSVDVDGKHEKIWRRYIDLARAVQKAAKLLPFNVTPTTRQTNGINPKRLFLNRYSGLSGRVKRNNVFDVEKLVQRASKLLTNGEEFVRKWKLEIFSGVVEQ